MVCQIERTVNIRDALTRKQILVRRREQASRALEKKRKEEKRRERTAESTFFILKVTLECIGPTHTLKRGSLQGSDSR